MRTTTPIRRMNLLFNSPMNNYHIDRCESLISDTSISRELRMVAESLVAIASGVDDADSMAHQALERIEITLERVELDGTATDRVGAADGCD